MLRPSTAAIRSTRQLASTLSRPTSIPATTRLFTTTLAHRAEGDTGGTRRGGAAQADAFSKREKASEDKYVREQEMRKLKALREKLKEQESNISSLKADIEQMIDEGSKEEKK